MKKTPISKQNLNNLLDFKNSDQVTSLDKKLKKKHQRFT